MRFKYRGWIAVAGILVGTTARSDGPSAPPTKISIADFPALTNVSDPRISPDGDRIVFTRKDVDTREDRSKSTLWIMNADGREPRFLAKGASAAWSPDGARLAYVAPDESGQNEIVVRWMNEGGATQVITRGASWPDTLRWSPDGRRIGFTAWVGRETEWAIGLPPMPSGAKWAAPPHIVDRLHFRSDGAGDIDGGYTHLFVVPAEGGKIRQVTSGDWSVGLWWDGPQSAGWDWTPDGRTIVFDALRAPDADLRYEDCDINAVDVTTGNVRTVTTARGLWHAPAVSPDGRWIAFVGFPAKTESYQSQELYVVPIGGGPPRKISTGLDRDVVELVWSADAERVYFTAQDRGAQNLYAATRNGAVTRMTSAAQVLELGNLDRRGTAVAIRSSLSAPPHVVSLRLEQPDRTKQLTHFNDGLLRRLMLASVEEIEYASSGGARIQGWLYKPPDFQPARRYPMILYIHGGPVYMGHVGFSFRLQFYAAAGYVVLYANPRSSSGYGTDFHNATSFDFPSLDYDDLMAGVDAVLARGYVDPARLFVAGLSYGGTLTAWTVGHTSRFAAAAATAPNIDWISWAGVSDLPLSGTHFLFRKPFWEDPQPWLSHSPLLYVGRVTTPTLLMAGDLDLRTTLAQSEEFYVALKTRGVPTRLIRIPGEYHILTRPSNIMRQMLYTLAWFGEYDREASRPGEAATPRQPL